jgi:hypothetical protein
MTRQVAESHRFWVRAPAAQAVGHDHQPGAETRRRRQFGWLVNVVRNAGRTQLLWVI